MQQHAEDEAPDASRCFVLTCVGEPDCRKQLLASGAARNALPLSDREPRDFHGPALGTRHERSAWASGCGHGKSCFAYTFAALMRAFAASTCHSDGPSVVGKYTCRHAPCYTSEARNAAALNVFCCVSAAVTERDDVTSILANDYKDNVLQASRHDV